MAGQAAPAGKGCPAPSCLSGSHPPQTAPKKKAARENACKPEKGTNTQTQGLLFLWSVCSRVYLVVNQEGRTWKASEKSV